MKKATMLFVLTMILSAPVFAATIQVPGEFPTIQAGIDTAVVGDTILVAPGTYYESLSYGGKDVVVVSESGPEQTIIDGSDSLDTVVLFVNQESRAAVLEGFTIQNGSGITKYPGVNDERFAGGICIRFDSSPTLRNLIVTNNSVPIDEHINNAAGGIGIAFGSAPLLEDVVISNNQARYGGGIYSHYAAPVLKNVTIRDNFAHRSGGGAGFKTSTPTINNILVQGNTAGNRGGGFFIYDTSDVVINGATFYGNDGGPGGGAIVTINRNNVSVINSICWNNAPDEIASFIYYGGGYDFGPGHIGITNSDIEGGSSGLSFERGELIFDTDNLNLNPLFEDVGQEDFTLADGSPCIDSGTALFVWGEDTLINVPDSLYIGLRPDMGAIESPYTVGIEESNLLPDGFALYQNFPNPFNPSTTIRYALPEVSDVTLTIYDIRGREVMQIVNSDLATGYYDIKWSGFTATGNMVSTGVYFCRINAGSYTSTIKMLMMK